MVVWSGRGIWIPRFFFIIFLCLVLLTPLTFDDKATVAIAAFATALFSLIMGRIWNRQTYESAYRKHMGEPVEIVHLSTLFWIRMELWFWIFTIVGILALFGVFH